MIIAEPKSKTVEKTPVQNLRTMHKRRELFHDRWTIAGGASGVAEVSDLLSPSDLKRFGIFDKYDDAFLTEISHDVSVAQWKSGAVLFEEGGYIDVAFFIVTGSVDVFVNGTSEARIGGSHHDQQTRKNRKSRQRLTYLSVMDFNLPINGRMRLGSGHVFGEIGALSGWPQSVTARTATKCLLVQIRKPALRKMRDQSPHFKDWIDDIYRKNYLPLELKRTPAFRKCGGEFIKALSQKVELVSCRKDAEIVLQGAPVQSVYIVRAGFVKLSQNVDGRPFVVSYLSKGQILGDVELLMEGVETWQFTASSVKRSELIKISRRDFEEIFMTHPAVEKQLWRRAEKRIKESGHIKENLNGAAFLDDALEKGLPQGRSILVINLDQCTRCDDCVRACADMHGGRPRFVREGDRFENFLITRACYHCHDPACLIGCPTGAIHRAGVRGLVEIEPQLCIGCRTCERNCPYDAITMVETGEKWSANMIPEHLRGKDRLVSSKCDLCAGSSHGPACVNNCPNGCAWRIGSLAELQDLLNQ